MSIHYFRVDHNTEKSMNQWKKTVASGGVLPRFKQMFNDIRHPLRTLGKIKNSKPRQKVMLARGSGTLGPIGMAGQAALIGQTAYSLHKERKDNNAKRIK